MKETFEDFLKNYKERFLKEEYFKHPEVEELTDILHSGIPHKVALYAVRHFALWAFGLIKSFYNDKYIRYTGDSFSEVYDMLTNFSSLVIRFFNIEGMPYELPYERERFRYFEYETMEDVFSRMEDFLKCIKEDAETIED